MKTGEVVASMPVLDDLPESYQVAIENSAIVYDDGAGTVSTIVCNWFGAGNAGLADPNSDSSIQSYANIYDQNWLMKGNVMIAPGVERVDTVKTDSGYEMPATAAMRSTAQRAIWSCCACRIALCICRRCRIVMWIWIRRQETFFPRSSLSRAAVKVRLPAGAIPQPFATCIPTLR